MEPELIQLLIKYKEGQGQLTLDIQLDATVKQVVEECIKQGVERMEMKVIYKGRVLRENDTLKGKNIKNNDTLYLYKSRNQERFYQQEQQQPQTVENQQQQEEDNEMQQFIKKYSQNLASNTGATLDLGFAGSLISNPYVKQILPQMLQNPQMLEMIYALNPSLKNMMEMNPDLKELFQKPEYIMQMMDLLTQSQGQQNNQTIKNQDQQTQGLFDMFSLQELFGNLNFQGAFSQLGNTDFTNMIQSSQSGMQQTNSQQPQQAQHQEDLIENYKEILIEEFDVKGFLDVLVELSDVGLVNISEDIIALKETNGNIEEAFKRIMH